MSTADQIAARLADCRLLMGAVQAQIDAWADIIARMPPGRPALVHAYHAQYRLRGRLADLERRIRALERASRLASETRGGLDSGSANVAP